MKFYNYLNEQNKLSDYLSQIEQECGRYLNDLVSIGGRIENLLYSGRKDNNDFIEKKVRKNRKPMDTPEYLHNWLDDWFEYKFGIRLRSNSLFIDPEISVAETYGNPYIVFPKGKYKIFWNPEISDLYNLFVKEKSSHIDMREVTQKPLKDYNYSEISNDLKFLFEKLEEYKEGDLQGALESETEIMLYCNSYYGLSLSYGERHPDEILEWFKNNNINVHIKAIGG